MERVNRMDNSYPIEGGGLTSDQVKQVITKPGWEKKTPQVLAEPTFPEAVALLMDENEGFDSDGEGDGPRVPEPPSPQELVRKALL